MLAEDVLGVSLEVDGVVDPCGVFGEAFAWLHNVVLLFVCNVTC